MIDFVKIQTRQPISFLENSNLEFIGTFKQNGGEILNKYLAEHKGLKFTYFETTNLLMITGSLHKYFNNGLHNYNDFNYNNLIFVLNDLKNKFNLNLENCFLQNIEFGLNIQLENNVNDLLDNLLMHKAEIYKDILVNNGYLKQVNYNQFIIKAYNKGLQYNRSENIFRFEIKIIKMQKIKNLNLKTLNDLKQKEILNNFFKVLKSEWQNIILFENPKPETNLKPILKTKKLIEWISVKYWKTLSKQARNRQKVEFYNYIENHTENLFLKISNLLDTKIKTLLK